MPPTWTERANAVEELLRKIPVTDAQKHRDAYNAAWELCEQLKSAEADSDGGLIFGSLGE